MGLELFSPDEDRSAVVTAVRMPDGMDSAELARALRDRHGVTIAGGQGELKGLIFRIGHIGWYDEFDIATALSAVELVLGELGAPIERGSGGDAGARGVRGGGDGLKVLVREAIAPAGVDLLRARFDVDEDADSPLEEIIGGYDAIVIRSATKLTAEVIERADRLKVIGRAGVGIDNVDVGAATRRGIVVANAPDSTVVSAAEHTIGLLVALARNIPQAHAALKEGRWERSRWGGIELADKTLGVLGFGRIGRQVARRALGLGMHVDRLRPVRRARALPRARRRPRGDSGVRPRGRRLPHAPSAADRRDARLRRRGRAREDARRRPDRQRRTRRARRRGGAGRGHSLRQGRRRGARRLLRRAVRGRAARVRERRRDAAPRRVDRRGPGPCRPDRRRAGRRCARRRARHERGQHPGRRRRGSRGARPVHPARGQARPARGRARRRPSAPDRSLLPRRDRRPRHAPA